MRTKVVYVLISSPEDYYAEQTIFSMASLRKHNPYAVVEVVCDRETFDSLSGSRALIKEMADDIIVREFTADIDPKRRSRILKTTLRNIIAGDYLFVDSDTVVCRSLSEIDSCKYPLAMAYDCNRTTLLNDSDSDIMERCSMVSGIDIKGAPYFNSGVIFAKDVPDVHDFYKVWHGHWKISEKTGIVYDQPPLCIANIEQGYVIGKLDDSWNCQFKYSGFPKDAYIIHYFNPGHGLELHDSPAAYFIFEEIRHNGLTTPYLTTLLDNPYTTLCVMLQIKKDSMGAFCSSRFLGLWFSSTRLFKLLERIAVLRKY